MKATQAQLLSLLDGKKQFIVPIYQRTYTWKIKQCKQLLEDIIRVGRSENEESHFIGSIVYFTPELTTQTSVPELLVIDGQQRLTTVSLLLLALTEFLKKEDEVIADETWEEIKDTYLINGHRKDVSKYKLLLTKKDKNTYIGLLDGIESEENKSEKIYQNFSFFLNEINRDNAKLIYLGIKKLTIVDVLLERNRDNPQLIFESLNSTGIDLNQADLIRNFVLMGQVVDKQNYLYEKYWYPMEQSFGEGISSLAYFIRDYLTMKTSSIPNLNLVYETYKEFLKKEFGFNHIEKAVEDLFNYSKYYVRIVFNKEQDKDLLNRFKQINKLRIDTSFPLLLAIYDDFENESISKDEFIEILDLIISYVFRRLICGIPTNSLNKTFATFYKKIKSEEYLESVKAIFLLLDSYKKFPSDTEFKKELLIKEVYTIRSRNYLLESLENWKRKELVNVENYTIEHILPQNENLSQEWRDELGENWKEVKDKYLHTLGNLTLTAYNSELSDKPFDTKKKIEGGFNSSPLFLNESVRVEPRWDEESVLRRASKLSDRACTIWKAPSISEERIELYKEPVKSKQEVEYSIDDHPYLVNEMSELYNALEKRVLNLDSSVRIEFRKLYVAFKAQTNFVDVIPQKKRLLLSLNVSFEDIRDPKEICRDVSTMGRWGNGDVEVGYDNLDDLDYIMELVDQAFEAQLYSEK